MYRLESEYCYIMNCKVSIILAYLMSVYCMATISYLIATANIGTPFKDSLTPEQLEIKKKSADERLQIFVSGITVSSIILYLWKQFDQCA